MQLGSSWAAHIEAAGSRVQTVRAILPNDVIINLADQLYQRVAFIETSVHVQSMLTFVTTAMPKLNRLVIIASILGGNLGDRS